MISRDNSYIIVVYYQYYYNHICTYRSHIERVVHRMGHNDFLFSSRCWFHPNLWILRINVRCYNIIYYIHNMYHYVACVSFRDYKLKFQLCNKLIIYGRIMCLQVIRWCLWNRLHCSLSSWHRPISIVRHKTSWTKRLQWSSSKNQKNLMPNGNRWAIVIILIRYYMYPIYTIRVI